MLVFMIILIIVFYRLALKKKYNIPYLLLAVTCGAAGTIIRSLGMIISDPLIESITARLFFFFIGGLTVFFFFFEESCSSFKPSIPGVIAVISLFIVSQIFNLYSLSNSLSTETAQEFRMIGLFFYGILGIISFGYFGIKFYMKSYRLTREKMALILTIGMIIGLIAYSLIAFSAIYFRGDIDINNPLGIIVATLSPIMTAIFSLSYLFNIDYVYRLPHNYYLLMAFYKSGIQIYHAEIESNRNIKIESHLVSGFFTAVNSLFVESLSAETNVENISSSDAALVIGSGEYISVVVIGEKSTSKLQDAVSSFVEDIEAKYGPLLQEHESNIDKYRGIKDLIPASFPFFKIKE